MLPFFVILAIAFGRVDPIFLTPSPVYNPLRRDVGPFRDVLSEIFARGSVYQSDFVRTPAFVFAATALCLAIGYPVAYFIARQAARFRTVFLVAFIVPFWISYMMRMLPGSTSSSRTAT